MINMLNKINMLREKLENQILDNEPYDKVLDTSREIDKLLVDYYNLEKEGLGELVLIK